MEKQYLVAYGVLENEDLISYEGYLQCLKDSKILKGKLDSNAYFSYKELSPDFEKVFEKDKSLKNKLEERFLSDSTLRLDVIRLEVENEGRLTPRLLDLKENYPMLDFITYKSDFK